MSELPPAPPMQPGSLPPDPDRWLGRRAPYWGLFWGLVAYVPGLAFAIDYIADRPAGSTNDDVIAAVLSLVTSLLATLIVLIIVIVMVSIPRTRGFGAGLAIALAIGVIGGAGVCATMISVG